jgi:hypothetical protein
MTVIPSGKGAFEWLPNTNGLTKTASSDNGEVVEEKDELLEAAKKVVAQFNFEKSDDSEESNDLGGSDGETDDSDSFGDPDGVEFENSVTEVSDEVDGDEECNDKTIVEKLEGAKEELEEAIDCLGGGSGDAPEEFEAEVELELDGDVELDVDDDSGEDVSDDDVVEGGVECDEDEEDCDNTLDASVEASSDDWVKVANITPKNRKAIYDYWSKQLNYPKDFVKLMVKDYEK